MTKAPLTMGCFVIGAISGGVACGDASDPVGPAVDGPMESTAPDGAPDAMGTMGGGCPLAGELEPETVLSACATLSPSETCANGEREPGELCFRSMELPQPVLRSVMPVTWDNGAKVLLGWRIAAGDLDGDGLLDIVASVRGVAAAPAFPAGAHALVVFWGAGGTFESGVEIGAGTGTVNDPRIVEVGDPRVVDLDSDGRLDVVVWSAEGLEAYYGDGDRRFERRVFALPDESEDGVSVGDFNADGAEDILVDEGHLLPGAGQRSLGGYEKMAPGGMTLGRVVAVDDFDGDGSRDLVAHFTPEGKTRAQWRVALGMGDGGTDAASVVPESDQRWIFLGNLYGNQVQELAGLSHTAGEDRVVKLELRLWNLSGGAYELRPDVVSLTPLQQFRGARPIAPASADVDGDGDADLVFSLEYAFGLMDCEVPPAWRAVHIVLGDGQGNFSEPECHPALQEPPLDLAVADFNGDGIADIAAVSMFGGIEVLLSNP